MTSSIDKNTALIESILFLENDPIDIVILSSKTRLSRSEVRDALTQLSVKYKKPCHGIEIVELGGGYLFAPKAELWPLLKGQYGKMNENRLSKAALETLSIIAYSQPVTKPEIERIRGVSSDGMVTLLLDRSLIRKIGEKETPGRPIQYGTTKQFLITFGLKSIADLPKLDEMEFEKFERKE